MNSIPSLLAALALACTLAGCQTTRPKPGIAMPTPAPIPASIQVLIDNDGIPSNGPCRCWTVPDSLRHQPKKP